VKRSSLTPLALILGWLVSLGFVFVLGLFAAFTFHRAPDNKDLSDFSPEEREGIVLAENLLGQSLDLDQFVSVDPKAQLPEQFVALIGALNGVTDPVERSFMSRRIAQLLPSSKVPRAIQWMLEQPITAASDELIIYLLQRWGQGDGRNGMQYVLTVLPPRFGEEAILAVLSGWGQKDGRAAWGWVNGDQIDPNVKIERLSQVLWAMHGETMGAAALLEQIGNVEILSSVAAKYAGMVRVQDGSEAAVDWMSTALKEWDELLIGQFVRDWSWDRPTEASLWVDTLPSPAHEWGMSAVAPVWAGSQGKAALNWVLSSPASGVRAITLATTTNAWIDAEGLNVVADFLNTKNPSPALDPIIEQLAYQTMEIDAETALSWAKAIQDESKRLYAISVVSSYWIRSDKSVDLDYVRSQVGDSGAAGFIEERQSTPPIETGEGIDSVELKPGESIEVIDSDGQGEPVYIEITD